MTTPTTREIADEIAKRYTREGTGYADRLYQLSYAIEQALRDEGERCAKVAEGDDVKCEPNNCHASIAAAIRRDDKQEGGGDTNGK